MPWDRKYQQGMDNIQVIVSAKDPQQMEFLLRLSVDDLLLYSDGEYSEDALQSALDASVQASKPRSHCRRSLYHLMIEMKNSRFNHLYQSIDCFSLTDSLRLNIRFRLRQRL